MKGFGLWIGLWLVARLAVGQGQDTLPIVRPLDAYAQHLSDSLSRARNRPTFSNIFLTGYAYHDRTRQRYVNVGPLLDHFFQFNTVEGWLLGQRLEFNQGFRQEKRFLSTSLDARYGFASRNFYMQGQATYWFDRVRNRHLHVEGGRFVRQFNDQEPISFLQNTGATLFRGINPLKLYELRFAMVRFRQPLGTRWGLVPSLELATRLPLRNQADYSFRRRDKRRFTSNDPFEPEGNGLAFPRHDAYLAGLALEFAPDRGPALALHYRQTLGGSGPDARFSKIWFTLRETVYRESIGEFRLEASAGTFLSRRRVYLVDYWHFAGNELLTVRNRLPQFFLLPFYSQSTDRSFAQVFAEHHFNGHFFNRSPILRALGWQEVLGARALYTPEKRLYVELNAGIENIFNVGRVDLVTAFGEPLGAKFAVRYAIGL